LVVYGGFGLTILSPENRNRFSFWNLVFFF